MSTAAADAKPGIDAAEIARVLEPFPEVAAAWLFGSEARGEAREGSDVDIALLLRERGVKAVEVYELLGTLAARLESVAPGRVIDRVLIESQGPILQHAISSEGRLVYEADFVRRVDFESDAYVRYLDFAPTYELARRHALAGIQKRLGALE